MVWTLCAALGINFVCVGFAGYTETHYWYYAMFAILSTGLIVFFGIISQNLKATTDKVVDSQSMRPALAGLITSSYLIMVAYCIFTPGDMKLSELSATLITHFTAIVGVVLAFFFGSSAYIEAQSKKS